MLGFECDSGKPVKITPNHLVVTGITDESGKTTTLEALIVRSGLTAVLFKTKPGEKGFTQGTEIPPFFKERSDWEYVESLFEAAMKERMRFERSWIINACKNTDSLLAVANKVKESLASGEMDGKKLNNLSMSVYTTLNAYFEKILPQLQATRFSNTLDLQEGVNIINLERFSFEVQALVVNSVMEEVLRKNKNIIIVVPESWKFMPQGRNTPCKLSGEALIRQGATNRNLLWLDSQDITGVEKTILKQVSTWVLGKQNEVNEIKRSLAQIPLMKSQKPKPEEIALLKVGHFYVVTSQFTKKVYVQPSWLDERTAKAIARGKKKVEGIKRPDKIAPFTVQPLVKPPVQPQTNLESQKVYAKIQQELVELRQDFFNKIQEQQEYIQKVYEQINQLQAQQPQVNEDSIVSKVLQKMPAQTPVSSGIPSNIDEIVGKVLSRIPKVPGAVTYEIAPLEKLKKDFLEEAKQELLSAISSCDEKQKKMLKWVEQRGSYANKRDIFYNCFGSGATSGSTYQSLVKNLTDMKQKEILKIDTHNRVYPILKTRIGQLIEQYGATKEEIEQVYSHIIMEMLGGKT